MPIDPLSNHICATERSWMGGRVGGGAGVRDGPGGGRHGQPRVGGTDTGW